jgi:hypothetical protein
MCRDRGGGNPGFRHPVATIWRNAPEKPATLVDGEATEALRSGVALHRHQFLLFDFAIMMSKNRRSFSEIDTYYNLDCT